MIDRDDNGRKRLLAAMGHCFAYFTMQNNPRWARFCLEAIENATKIEPVAQRLEPAAHNGSGAGSNPAGFTNSNLLLQPQTLTGAAVERDRAVKESACNIADPKPCPDCTC